MRRWIALGLAVGLAGGGLPARAQRKPDLVSPSLLNLREEISRINLLNGINLTRAQLVRYRKILAEVDDARSIFAAEQKRHEELETPQFNKLKAIVSKGDPLPHDFYMTLRSLDDNNRIITNKYLRALMPLEAQLRQVLTPAQIEMTQKFAECLVPLPDQQDPERIGQAGNNHEAQVMLRKVRKMSAADFAKQEAPLVEEVVTNIENDFGLLATTERDTITRRFRTLLEEARTLPDVRFAHRIGDMAKELDPEMQDIWHRGALADREMTLVGGPTKLGRFLLDARLMPVVEARLKLAGEPQVQTAPCACMLSSKLRAETCTAHKCSVATVAALGSLATAVSSGVHP